MKRVLVVEDDPDLADTLAELLRRRYDVQIAPDGLEAIRKLSSDDFDAVVLDLMLPHLSGEGVLAELGARGLRVPVSIATARDDGGEVMARGGAADWLRKPFAISDLFDKLERVLAGNSTGGGGGGSLTSGASLSPESGETGAAPAGARGVADDSRRSDSARREPAPARSAP